MRLAVLASAGDVVEEEAARSAGAWLAFRARLERPEGARLQRLAEALDERYAGLAAAMLAGEVSLAQAEVVAAALDQLPPVDPELRREAERHLVQRCADFGPRELRVLGRRILDVVAPDVAEKHKRRALAREEQRARRAMRVTTRPLGEGLTASSPTSRRSTPPAGHPAPRVRITAT